MPISATSANAVNTTIINSSTSNGNLLTTPPTVASPTESLNQPPQPTPAVPSSIEQTTTATSEPTINSVETHMPISATSANAVNTTIINSSTNNANLSTTPPTVASPTESLNQTPQPTPAVPSSIEQTTTATSEPTVNSVETHMPISATSANAASIADPLVSQSSIVAGSTSTVVSNQSISSPNEVSPGNALVIEGPINLAISEQGVVTQTTIVNYLEQNSSFSKAAIAGIVGNLMYESGLNTERLENTTPAAVTPINALSSDDLHSADLGWGLAQWTPASKLVNWATAQGKDPNLVSTQLEFIVAGVNSNPALLSQLQACTSASQAADIFRINYERPADTPTSTAGRETYAKQVFAAISQN